MRDNCFLSSREIFCPLPMDRTPFHPSDSSSGLLQRPSLRRTHNDLTSPNLFFLIPDLGPSTASIVPPRSQLVKVLCMSQPPRPPKDPPNDTRQVTSEASSKPLFSSLRFVSSSFLLDQSAALFWPFAVGLSLLLLVRQELSAVLAKNLWCFDCIGCRLSKNRH